MSRGTPGLFANRIPSSSDSPHHISLAGRSLNRNRNLSFSVPGACNPMLTVVPIPRVSSKSFPHCLDVRKRATEYSVKRAWRAVMIENRLHAIHVAPRQQPSARQTEFVAGDRNWQLIFGLAQWEAYVGAANTPVNIVHLHNRAPLTRIERVHFGVDQEFDLLHRLDNAAVAEM